MSEAAEDPISLSFIDCISCGLAAALFMFLVFSAIPRSAALVEARIAEAGTSGTEASALPSTLAGGGTAVPVDIRIVFDRGLVSSERSGAWSPGPVQVGSTFTAADGTITAYLGSFKSGETPPSFELRTATDSLPISGTISIRAGSDAVRIRFTCPQALAGATQVVIAFDLEGPRSDCPP